MVLSEEASRLRSEFIYLAVIMDVFTRIIRGWCVSPSLEVELTLTALEQALVKGVPSIYHSDQGMQYAATEYTERLLEAGVLIFLALLLLHIHLLAAISRDVDLIFESQWSNQ